MILAANTGFGAAQGGGLFGQKPASTPGFGQPAGNRFS